jgi:uncharacterized protein (TIGR03437 family)
VNALMYYTSATQIAALLPSNTPTGGGTFTVTFNGETSNQVGHAIVASNLGIFTIDSSGEGPGIVTYPDYSLVSAAKAANCGGPNTACGAANPGDTLILWATGLGPVRGNDAAGEGLGQPMPEVPLTVWLGGVRAPVIYQGRSGCCIGLDQVVFTVPDGVPAGCAVPLVIQVGATANTISNTTVMPVAAVSRNCTPSDRALAAVDLHRSIVDGPVSFADITFNHDLTGGPPLRFEDRAEFIFGRLLSARPGTQPFFASWIDRPPVGTCIVYNHLNGASEPPVTDVAPLNAGSSFAVRGPNGSMSLTGGLGGFNTMLSAAGSFLAPGPYTITGSGGPDVGPFSAAITLPAPPVLVSPVTPATVTRSSGMTVTWTGGDADGIVSMVVRSATDNTFTNAREARCTAPASAGSFTIPPYALLQLPGGTNFAGFLFRSEPPAAPFSATGIHLGMLSIRQAVAAVGYGVGTTLTLR